MASSWGLRGLQQAATPQPVPQLAISDRRAPSQVLEVLLPLGDMGEVLGVLDRGRAG